MIKNLFLAAGAFIIVLGISGCSLSNHNGNTAIIGGADGPTAIFITSKSRAANEPKNQIERVTCSSDQDGDGSNDTDDILEGARKDAANKPRYKDGYYQGGYPPEDEGVCTDVIWRAFQNAGYNLKEMVDEDIKNNVALYPRVEGKPDPNIDFRRIKNLRVFVVRMNDHPP